MTDPANLIAELEADSRRTGYCSVCTWIEGREDADVWDTVCAIPVRRIGHTAIYRRISKLGYESNSTKPVEQHRNGRHRVPG